MCVRVNSLHVLKEVFGVEHRDEGSVGVRHDDDGCTRHPLLLLVGRLGGRRGPTRGGARGVVDDGGSTAGGLRGGGVGGLGKGNSAVAEKMIRYNGRK